MHKMWVTAAAGQGSQEGDFGQQPAGKCLSWFFLLVRLLLTTFSRGGVLGAGLGWEAMLLWAASLSAAPGCHAGLCFVFFCFFSCCDVKARVGGLLLTLL